MDISRRTVLKGVGATAAGVVAASTVTLNSADAAAKINQVGTVWIPFLWGMKKVKVRIPGSRPARYEIKQVENTRKLFKPSVVTNRAVNALLEKGMWLQKGVAGTDSPWDSGAVILFGHRTHAGGPMRNSHFLRGEVEDLCAEMATSLDPKIKAKAEARLALPADVIYVNGFEYIVEQVKVWPVYKPTKKKTAEENYAEAQKASVAQSNILNYPAELPGAAGGRLSIIACTKPNGLPTGSKNRIVVRARLNTAPPV